MGIVSNIKGKITAGLTKSAMKAADGIAKAAQLSSKQIEDIEKRKKDYLAEKPDMNSTENQELVRRMLGTIGVEVYHAYLPELNTIYTPITTVPANYAASNRIAYFDITKWVLDVEENYLDKLVNVYHVLSQEDCTIALIFHRTMHDCKVTMAVVNNSTDNDPSKVTSYKIRLQEAIMGNFPGVVLSNEEGRGIPKCLADFDKSKNIAAVTNIATEKSERFISQSIEKLLDGVVPQKREQEYTFVLLATPTMETFSDQSRLSEMYTAMAPFASWQTNFTYTTSDNVNSSFSGGVHLGASAGASTGSGIANTLGKAVSHAESKSRTDTGGVSVGGSIKGVGVQGNYSHAYTRGSTDTVSRSQSNTQSHNTGANAGINFGVNFNRASNVSVNVGKNEGITQSFTNHQIKHTLDILDMQMKRLEQCAALGMWKFASYVISDDYNTANNAAHMYLALTQGEESFISQSAINLWHCGRSPEETKILLREISHLQHPAFCLRSDLNEEWLMYPTTVDATTTVSGRELAYAFNLPRKSVAGFPVIECAEFGRNIVTYNEDDRSEGKIDLGSIFHMHHKESTDVTLSLQSLTSHTFITGSTGAGKSNTIYHILNDVKRKGIPFLVIEPAKGEYKHIFGNKKNVSVYGTNPKITSLLRLNPFSFPNDIHILEHLDRLVEIFNVCWPMYAAMPAVLKNAIEKSYEDCGWNLAESSNNYGENMYPTFADVARNIRTIIDSSEYDAENKGAYKGSLLTRLQSLTNGINGMIFNVDELSEEELFDENVIIDLSRVGSNETKSLIMGMIILKLQEYRMTSGNINSSLNHVTVLEEAHNLLKRTSSEQTSEGSNLLGKSVEMIANAIAEMRTYGEGFIIADQAPALLDMAAIRNTNTKIIMRLPDKSDRELVGWAANLNEEQINELAKLPCGVAAVYQNEWIQPVLCQVERFNTVDKMFSYTPVPSVEKGHDISSALKIAEVLCNGTKISRTDITKNILPYLKESGLTPAMQVTAANMLENPPKNPKFTKLAPIIGALFPNVKQAVKISYSESANEAEWTATADSALRACINHLTVADNVRRDIIQAIMTDYLYVELGQANELQRWAERGELK